MTQDRFQIMDRLFDPKNRLNPIWGALETGETASQPLEWLLEVAERSAGRLAW
jgi:hypothetical protein